jgi:hypothetical protein
VEVGTAADGAADAGVSGGAGLVVGVEAAVAGGDGGAGLGVGAVEASAGGATFGVAEAGGSDLAAAAALGSGVGRATVATLVGSSRSLR